MEGEPFLKKIIIKKRRLEPFLELEREKDGGKKQIEEKQEDEEQKQV